MPKLSPFTTTKLKEVYQISRGKYQVNITLTPEHISIDDEDEDSFKEFIFASSNSKETVARWGNILAVLNQAVVVLKQKQKEFSK